MSILKWRAKSLLVDLTDTSTVYDLIAKNATLIYEFVDSLEAHKGYSRGNFAKAVTGSQILIDLTQKFYRKYSKDTILSSKLSDYYGAASYYQLFTRDFGGAVHSALRGLSIKNQEFIYSNLAAGYLLSGNYNAAFKIYSSYKSKKYHEDSNFSHFKDVFLSDLYTLKAAGVINRKESKIFEQTNNIIAYLKR